MALAHRGLVRRFLLTVVCAALVATLLGNAVTAQTRLTGNPYQNVDWKRASRLKGNLHTHTTESDGALKPSQVIDEYHQRGYRVLAITDHNRCTWPWDRFDRSASSLGMLAIVGNELSRSHHTLSLFCDFETKESDLNATLVGVAAADGLAVLCHPAMHWQNNHGTVAEALPTYVNLFTKHRQLIGTEVHNGTRPMKEYPLDRELWDQLLMALMPGRPVWGFGTDDMHGMGHLGCNWVVFLAPTLDQQAVRRALVEGTFYFSSNRMAKPDKVGPGSPPDIIDIVHYPEAGTITLHATADGKPLPDDAYVWIADGKTVCTGPCLPYRTTPDIGAYVRAEITSKDGVTYTNPFGFRHE